MIEKLAKLAIIFEKAISHPDSLEKFEALLDDFSSNNINEVGEGSSRKVFIYNENVIKFAKNTKGLAQNTLETYIYNKCPEAKEILGKIIEWHPKYYWIKMEKATPLESEEEFTKLTGIPWKIFKYFSKKDPKDIDNKVIFYNEKVEQFFKNAIKTKQELNLIGGDFFKPKHWARTPDDRLVLIDYGANKNIYNKYYKEEKENPTHK
jgi:hypothetical protein